MPNGTLYIGQFKDGKPWDGTGYTESKEILGKFVNGVIQQYDFQIKNHFMLIEI